MKTLHEVEREAALVASLKAENLYLKELCRKNEIDYSGSDCHRAQYEALTRSSLRGFATMNNLKRHHVLTLGALKSLPNLKYDGRNYKQAYATACNELDKASSDLLSFENDFRSLNHFIKNGYDERQGGFNVG